MNAKRIRDGLDFLLSLGPVEVCAVHDRFLACGPELSEEDSNKMESLGWERDPDQPDGWFCWC